MKNRGYIGTYDENGSEGIYRFDFDKGNLTNVKLFSRIKNAKYLQYYQDMIVTIGDIDQRAGIYLLDLSGDVIDSLAYEAVTSCYVTCLDNKIYTTNYHQGTVTEIAIIERRLYHLETVLVENGAGCHQIIFSDGLIYVPCLLIDEIRIFDEELNVENTIYFPKGFGPRHGVFSMDKKWLYVLGELSNEIAVINAKENKIVKTITILTKQDHPAPKSAAIRLSHNGLFLYVSTRDENIISVFKVIEDDLELIQTISCKGDHPRDILIVDQYLLVANRRSNEVLSFKLIDGLVDIETFSRIVVNEGVVIAMED